jgi:hypothetical protein
MIDMGHALPMELKAEMVGKARSVDHDFAFWDENFSIMQTSRDEGYNAVFGYLWVDEHHADRMKNFFQNLESEGFPIPFFGTPENHNTPRAAARPGGMAYAHWALVVNSFIPAVPFVHSGYELAEKYPINTGLDFTPEQIKSLPSEKLPLFSEYGYDWRSKEEFSSLIRTVFSIRAKYARLIADPSPSTFRVLQCGNDRVFGFARIGGHPSKRLAVLANADFAGVEEATCPVDTNRNSLTDLLTGRKLKVSDGIVRCHLGAGECMLFEF